MAQCKKCKRVFLDTELIKGYCDNCLDEIKNIRIPTKAVDSSLERDLPETDYGVSVGFNKFVAFIGWASIVVGIIGLLVIIKEGGLTFFMIMYPLVAIFFGFLFVIMGQTSRAILDNANYSRQMLIEMRRSTHGKK